MMMHNIKMVSMACMLLLAVSCAGKKEEIADIPVPGDEFVYIPDVEFEKELIEAGIDSDGTVNKRVLKSDIATVEKLRLTNSGYLTAIKSLQGIEGFTGLKRLYADGNALTSIDLSANVLLDTVHLGFNDLTTVNGLSEAKNLKWLSLSGNLFTEFTIHNPSIRNLLMSHNELVSLNTDACPNLRTVLLNINKITALDFRTNPLLEVLIFSANKIETIDLSANKALKYIYCSSNLLQSFDVSELPNLIDLRIDRNPTLTCIKIGPAQNIPTLKLSSYQQASVHCD